MYWQADGSLTLAGQALVASLLAGLAGGVGGLLVVVFSRISRRAYDTLLGFSAGVMLSAAALTLLWPALETGNLFVVATGLFAGGVMIWLLDRSVPHLEPHFAPKLINGRARFSLLLMAAIALHNIPEGLSVGVAYGHGEGRFGLIVAFAIAAQNIPEGMAVALPLRTHGSTRWAAFLWAAGTGLVEPLAAGLGFHLVRSAEFLVAFGQAAAAGAMVFVVSDQLIPESHRDPKSKAPSMALLAGFLLVALLVEFLSPGGSAG